MDQFDDIIADVRNAVSRNLAAVGDYMVAQLKSALPREVKHKGKFAPIRDGVTWSIPRTGAKARRRRSRIKSQLPLEQMFEPGASGSVDWIDSIVVSVPWPWLPNEVGHMTGFAMAKAPTGRRKREKRGTHYVPPNPIVRETFARCDGKIQAILGSLEGAAAA